MISFPFAAAVGALVAIGDWPLIPARVSDPIPGAGVSRELAERRSLLLSGIRYEMALSLERPDTARGHAVIRFLAKQSSEVVLDFRGPSLSNVMVNGGQTATIFTGAHLLIPAKAVHSGENVVTAP